MGRDKKNPSASLKPREQLSKSLLPRVNSSWRTLTNPSSWTAMSAELKLDGMTQKTRHKADLLFYKTPRMPGLDSLMGQNKLLLNSKREMKRSKRSRSDSTLPLPLKIWKRGKRS